MAVTTATAHADLIPDDPALEPGIRGLVQGGAWDFGGGQRVITYSLNSLGQFDGGSWDPARIAAINRVFDAWEAVADFRILPANGAVLNSEPDFSPANIAVNLSGNLLVTLFPPPGRVAGLSIFPDRSVGNQILSELRLSRAEYPNPEGDVYLDETLPQFANLSPGGWGYSLMLHELGHALGLKHPHDDGLNGRLTFAQLGIAGMDDGLWTVMSYNDPSDLLSRGQQATPMPLDILAIQHIYGPNLGHATGNNVYTLTVDGKVKTIWDAGGNDTLDASRLGFGVRLSLEPGTGLHHGAYSYTALAFAVEDGGSVVNYIENAVGTAYRDTLTGNAADNTLNGGGGSDILIGGGGDDVYVVDSPGDQIVEDPGQGEDRVAALFSYALAAGGALEDLELRGKGRMEGSGNDFANLLVANAGITTLDGGGGDDTLRFDGGRLTSADTAAGGGGDDTLELGGTVEDSAFAHVSGIEHFALRAGGLPSLRLGPLSQAAGLDALSLAALPAGSRSLVDAAARTAGIAVAGGAADDTFVPGGGADSFDGGAGNDLLLLDRALIAGDHLDAGAGDDDRVSFLGAVAVADQDFDALRAVEHLLLGAPGAAHSAALGSGSEAAGILVADAGALRARDGAVVLDASLRSLGVSLLGGQGGDTLTGGAGSDLLKAGAGNDTYVAGSADSIVEAATGGRDLLITDDPPAALPANVEVLQLQGSGDLAATGNGLDNTLVGNAGDNTLDGGGGRDRLYGGPGDDTYLVDGGDQVFEDAGNGHDRVLSSASFTLPAHVESLLLTGSASCNGTASGGDDTLEGNAGVNTLSGGNGIDILLGAGSGDRLLGGAGNDSLDGGAGRDRLLGGAGDDRFVYDALDTQIAGGPGFDSVIVEGGGVSLTLSGVLRSVERIDLTGSGDNELSVGLAALKLDAPDLQRLVVDGNAGDMVESRAEGWAAAGTETLDGTAYQVFSLRGYQVLVHPDLTALFT